VVASDAFFITRRDKLAALAADHAVPTMYDIREYPVAGGLMSYAQERLSDILVDYWSTLARTGAPDAPGQSDLPPWPRYSADQDNIQAIDLSGQTQVGGYGKMYDCDFWDPIVTSQISPPK
jgi:hypothetical protein